MIFILCYITNWWKFYSKKVETIITNKEEESEKVGRSIQEMQGAMQKAAVEAAKAATIQAA